MKFKSLFILLLLSVITFAGCTGTRQFVASAGWSGVASDSAGELVYVGSKDGRVLALNAKTGGQRAIYPPLNQDPLEGIYGTPTVTDHAILISGYDGKLYALNPIDLSLRWQFPHDISTVGRIVGSSTVADGLVVFGASDGFVRAVKLSDGSLMWKYQTEHKVWSTPTVKNGTVYVGSLDHHLYAISLADGTLNWTAPFKAGGAIVVEPLVIDGKIIFGSFDANLYAVEYRSGDEIWRVKGDGWFWSSPISDGERVFAISTSGTTYSIDLSTGMVLGTYELDAQTLSKPVLAGNNLIVGSDDGLLSVLDRGTMQLTSQYDVGAEVRAPLQMNGSVVYVHAMDSTVWALRMAGRQEKVWQINTEDLTEG